MQLLVGLMFECNLRCFLRAVYGNVVFLWCLLTSMWCFNALPGSWINHVVCILYGFLTVRCLLNACSQSLLKFAYGHVVFARSKMDARHRDCRNPFMGMPYFLVQKWKHVTHILCVFRSLSIFSCSLRLWESFRGSGMVQRLLKSLESFGRLCRLCEVLRGFGRIWKALVCFGKLLGGFGRLWELL